jgi:hypothetical protein
MNRSDTIALALALALAAPAAAQPPAEAIGYVKTVRGDAAVATGPSVVPARPGTPLYVGSVVRTGADGSVGLALKDNTLLAAGPGSVLAVDDFRFAPAADSLGLTARILRGTIEVVSGMIAKLRPESVVVRTPSGTLGVRGTRFLVRVDDR